MRNVRTVIEPGFTRAIIAVLAVAVAFPLVIGALSLIFFLLVFYLEAILIGAYPFLGTVRVGVSTSTYAIDFPFNWILTAAQWGASAMIVAFKARSEGMTDLGSQIILACALWLATNFVVRLSFLVFGLSFVTTQVRM